MQNPAKFVVSAVNWVAAVGGVVGLLALLVPDVSSWMSGHGVAGWVAALVLLILAPLLTTATVGVERRQMRELRDRERTVKDLALVNEFLDGWTIDSDFFESLVEDLDHNYFPTDIRKQIEDRWLRWGRESREIRTPQLADGFGAVKSSVDVYRGELFARMWAKDEGPGTKSIDGFLSVPREWNQYQKDEAFEVLNSARSAVVKSLRGLYQVMHEHA